eukprot:8102121-Alexandrium_andersonii.AAC.1
MALCFITPFSLAQLTARQCLVVNGANFMVCCSIWIVTPDAASPSGCPRALWVYVDLWLRCRRGFNALLNFLGRRTRLLRPAP